MNLNKVMLMGRLGRNPDHAYTPAGAAVCKFSIAVSERWKDKQGISQEKTEWFKIITWGKLADICKEYLQKGNPVYIEGRLQTRSYQDKNGQEKHVTEVIGDVVKFLQSGPKDTAKADSQDVSESEDFDDIPF